jgi:UDP-N-acetylmuramate dehydrogenase
LMRTIFPRSRKYIKKVPVVEKKNLIFYKDYKLAKLSTFKIGGKAEYFCAPSNTEEVKEALCFSQKNNLPLTIIGGGANILISDKGIKGLVLSTKSLEKVFIKENIVVAESGISIEKLNTELIKNSLSGLEFSSGLPGSLGGAVYMNARAYSHEISESISSVCAITLSGEIVNYAKEELKFGYKKSLFMEKNDLLILYATFTLEKKDKKEIKRTYKKYLSDRKEKKQFDYPSAGCIFKNDYEKGVVSGKLIDELGLKGLRIGGAEIYKHHGNFIINKNRAKAEDVKNLIEKIEEEVYQQKGIKLEREVRLLGF